VRVIDAFTRETIIFIKYYTNSIRTDIQNMIKKQLNIHRQHFKNTKNLYNRCSKCLPYGLLDRKDRKIHQIDTELFIAYRKKYKLGYSSQCRTVFR